jgi:hypothetical protein
MATKISSPGAVTPTTLNAANAFADDGTNTGGFTSSSSDTTYSAFVSLGGGAGIPGGATINGIEVTIDASSNSKNYLEASVYNGTSWSSGVDVITRPGRSFSTIDPAWGGASDLWGLSWDATTAAGIQLKFDWSTLSGHFYIDHIQIRVTYTAASGYGNAVNGVAAANIAAVKGVAAANIEKIIGT